MSQLKANRNIPNTGGWQDRHDTAIVMNGAVSNEKPFETAVVQMIVGWARYAKNHHNAYQATIGDDGVLGKDWLAIGEGLIGLLNGQTGRLDCGTLDAFIRDTVHENGFPEKLA